MLTKITKRTVDAVRPSSADQFLWDRDLKGFGLKVTPTGNKVYLLQYRTGQGKRRCYNACQHVIGGVVRQLRTARGDHVRVLSH